MKSEILNQVLNTTKTFLISNYSVREQKLIFSEINKIVGSDIDKNIFSSQDYSYEELQIVLSTINEKGTNRKNNGVYYTPSDVVEFILINAAKMVSNRIKPNNLHVLDLNGIPFKSFCINKTIFDPTCGSGAFLLPALDLKLDLMELHYANLSKTNIFSVLKTIRGNDLDLDSIIITKLRLFLCVLHRFGATKVKGIAEILNRNFKSYDYVTNLEFLNEKYDIIVGNPPYVEYSKSDSKPTIRYGNIYANVLDNATKQLSDNGVMGFIIPLSYISTPRMKKIRDTLIKETPKQYILSYSDRPDCLFTSVHQKLCIFLGKKSLKREIVTSNYTYWYKEERPDLFINSKVVTNNFISDEFIPKLGITMDTNIYRKINSFDTSLFDLIQSEENSSGSFYLNMRATFWIKAFLNEHYSSEYKKFYCESEDFAYLCFCILNSSLFWWYWICISDCWHITNKELKMFKIPRISDYSQLYKLANKLEKELERTKVFVGTKQTEYEYKHKECVGIIHEIDDYINKIYELTDEESLYIKNFALRYRVSGGVKIERN